MHLASKTLGHAPLGPSTTAATMYGGVPGGTIASFLATCEDVPQNHLAITMADYSLSPVPGAPSPLPRLVYSFDGIGVGALPPFGSVNRALVQRTAGLLELARRETRRGRGGAGTSEARREDGPACYGPAFTYTEFMPTGGVVSAFLYSAGFITTIATLMFIAPVRVLFAFLLVPYASSGTVSEPTPHRVFVFTVAVGVQASGDAAGLWACR